MNEVVRDARMLRDLRQHAIQDLRRLLLLRIRLVVRRSDAEDGERVKDRGFKIRRIFALDVRHRFLVRDHARAVLELVGAGIERVDCIDERQLARRLRADLLRLLARPAALP